MSSCATDSSPLMAGLPGLSSRLLVSPRLRRQAASEPPTRLAEPCSAVDRLVLHGAGRGAAAVRRLLQCQSGALVSIRVVHYSFPQPVGNLQSLVNSHCSRERVAMFPCESDDGFCAAAVVDGRATSGAADLRRFAHKATHYRRCSTAEANALWRPASPHETVQTSEPRQAIIERQRHVSKGQ
jgi:hypothetical protein